MNSTLHYLTAVSIFTAGSLLWGMEPYTHYFNCISQVYGVQEKLSQQQPDLSDSSDIDHSAAPAHEIIQALLDNNISNLYRLFKLHKDAAYVTDQQGNNLFHVIMSPHVSLETLATLTSLLSHYPEDTHATLCAQKNRNGQTPEDLRTQIKDASGAALRHAFLHPVFFKITQDIPYTIKN